MKIWGLVVPVLGRRELREEQILPEAKVAAVVRSDNPAQNALCVNLSYVCLQPVLANDRFPIRKWQKTGWFAHRSAR